LPIDRGILNYNLFIRKGENLMENNQTNASSLPMMALDEIPEAKADAKEIIGLVKDSGKVTGYQLSDGQIVDKQEGIELARQGNIKGVGISSRNGNEYLKSLPDDTESNNLGNLPAVSGKNAEEEAR